MVRYVTIFPNMCLVDLGRKLCLRVYHVHVSPAAFDARAIDTLTDSARLLV